MNQETARESEDPKDQGIQPPFPEQAQAFPSLETRMNPAPDYGEKTYRGSGKLEGKVALITGADSGIGRAVALAFAREGADIFGTYFNEREDAEITARLVEEAGRKIFLAPADLRMEMECNRIVQQAVEQFGRIDLLVNNAAYTMSYHNIRAIITEEWQRTFQTNVDAIFFMCRTAVNHMPPGSAIINTASIEAYNPVPERLPYAATNGAIISLSKAMAGLLIRDGIRVNVVAPGPVWTPLVTYSRPAGEVSELGSDTPIGRPAQPAEVAPVYVLLASPEASYLTGGVYEVTGGAFVT